jgi:ABC-2 type transport system ATP-binding protein
VPDHGAHAVAQILPALEEAGITVPEFTLGQPSLDEVFLTITGKPLPDEDSDGARDNARETVDAEGVSR